MITCMVGEANVDCYSGDIVNNALDTSVGTVPFEWSTKFQLQQAIDAIAAYLAGAPGSVTSTGQGWIVDLPSQTHPQAEITEIDFVANLINFRWVGGSYGGDCATAFEFTLATTAADVRAAVQSLV